MFRMLSATICNGALRIIQDKIIHMYFHLEMTNNFDGMLNAQTYHIDPKYWYRSAFANSVDPN